MKKYGLGPNGGILTLLKGEGFLHWDQGRTSPSCPYTVTCRGDQCWPRMAGRHRKVEVNTDTYSKTKKKSRWFQCEPK
jgi:hypothetical protein